MAAVLFWITAIVLLVCVLLGGADELFESVEGLIIAVVLLVACVLGAYVSSLFLYAFGELVETNTRLVELAEMQPSRTAASVASADNFIKQ